MTYQNPFQRVVADLEIFFGGKSVESAPPNFSALRLTIEGFSDVAIFAPALTYDSTVPADFFWLTVTGAKAAIKHGGKSRRLEQSGMVIIPLTMVLLSIEPLKTSEQHRTLKISLKRTSESQVSVVPIVSGMIHINPLPSARDAALVASS